MKTLKTIAIFLTFSLGFLFSEEEKHNYLKKIYDSKEDGFEYHMKIFEIQYEKFNTNNERLN